RAVSDLSSASCSRAIRVRSVVESVVRWKAAACRPVASVARTSAAFTGAASPLAVNSAFNTTVSFESWPAHTVRPEANSWSADRQPAAGPLRVIGPVGWAGAVAVKTPKATRTVSRNDMTRLRGPAGVLSQIVATRPGGCRFHPAGYNHASRRSGV